MRSVIFSMAVSLDGFTAGPDGSIDWATPDEELMRFHNQQTREIAAQVCGRGLYQDMLGWETAEQTRSDPLDLEFARMWKAIPKVVFSTTLTQVEGNARLARTDVAGEIAALKEGSDDGVVAVGGARFAATASRLGLIDEYRLFVNPVVLGGGTPYFPGLAERVNLTLVETRAFSQVVYLRYRRSW